MHSLDECVLYKLLNVYCSYIIHKNSLDKSTVFVYFIIAISLRAVEIKGTVSVT